MKDNLAEDKIKDIEKNGIWIILEQVFSINAYFEVTSKYAWNIAGKFKKYFNSVTNDYIIEHILNSGKAVIIERGYPEFVTDYEYWFSKDEADKLIKDFKRNY